jgi:hypothetical protein
LRFTSFEGCSLSEHVTNRLRIGNQRVTGKSQSFDRVRGSFFIAGAACVSDEHWDIAKVGSVARCRFDSDLGCYTDGDEGVDAAISQSEVEPRPFKG